MARWWQTAVFYQIYPRSFADGNGDGIGDFAGITARLDYLRELGIDAIWLSPHFPSPFLDCGYDISDYMDVAPEYGTLADFRAFLDAAHARGIRVVLDLVLNHTSDQHPWFVESRAGRDNPRRDWYIWHDGRAGGPPNNWASIFGGSAWEYDATTDQYYYHAFLKEQPDLNWRNPAVKQAMWDVARFWLDMGVDGFRLDAVATVFEHPDLPNHALARAPDEIYNANLLTMDEYRTLMGYQIQQPGVHELMRELRQLIDTYPGDRVLLGEDEDVSYHGTGDDELHLVYNFPFMRTARLTPAHIRANQRERLVALPPDAWPTNTLNHHDAPRVWSRYGDGRHNDQLARLHAALLLTLKGTPFLFNGEEIGMADLELTRLEEVRDTAALSQYRILTERMGVAADEALAAVFAATRDRCRSPMQWSAGPNAGFCPPGVAPWLPTNSNADAGVNVATQEGDPASLLHFYRRLLRLRRATPALQTGEYHPLDEDDPDVLAFIRHDGTTGQRCLVALNFADELRHVNPATVGGTLRPLFAEPLANVIVAARLDLAPFGIVIAELV